MEDGLDNLYSWLFLEDNGVNDVFLDKEDTNKIHYKGSSCFATRMLLLKPYNIEAMKSTFMKIWQLKEGLEIKKVSDCVFLFYFDDPILWFTSKGLAGAAMEFQQIAFGFL